MKSKLKTVWFYDEVYKQNILFCIGSQEETKKYVLKNYHVELNFKSTEKGKAFDCHNSYGQIIWMSSFNRKPKEFGCLIHEIIHTSLFIMDVADIKINADNSEPLTYHTEFLMRRFLELYK